MRQSLLVALLVALSTGGWAQDIEAVPIFAFDQRNPGDRALTFNVGLAWPLFYQSLSGSIQGANLSLGGMLELDLDFYLNNHWRLGGSLRGSFNASPNGNLLFLVPILFRGSYEFKFWPFSWPVSLSAGMVLVSFKQAFQMDPALQLAGGMYYHVSSQWGFGLNLVYLWIAQLYGSSPWHQIPQEHSRLGNFLDISLGAVYHF